MSCKSSLESNIMAHPIEITQRLFFRTFEILLLYMPCFSFTTTSDQMTQQLLPYLWTSPALVIFSDRLFTKATIKKEHKETYDQESMLLIKKYDDETFAKCLQ